MAGRFSDFSDLGLVTGDSDGYRLSRSSETSYGLARSLTVVLGENAPIIDLYLRALSYAPANHLTLLRRRGTAIAFGPTIDAVMTSAWAQDRRGRALTAHETRHVRVDYGPESRAAGVYDSSIDALVLPSAYRAHDLERVVLHELGHALTYARAQVRPSLLANLPRALRDHVFSDLYEAERPEQTLHNRVHEALAEGYVWLIKGRVGALPAALSSDLIFMLQSVEDGDHVRFEFEMTPEGVRTSSRVPPEEIVDASDPQEGHLYASMRLPADATAYRLDEDELAIRRRRRRAA